ncbi:MAG: triose-phosphate isomerase [Chloroflexi bacterium]|nr:triose-phosphate isomerase [Chloroflexota bacterium]
MRQPLIAGNWKMYLDIGKAIKLTESLLAVVEYLEDREVVICPPFTMLYPIGRMVRDKHLKLGGQNLYPAAEGAFTGEISPDMLLDCWCRYVILGHSERRQYFHETDEFINQKVKSALAAGQERRQVNLTPILCVGEREAERSAGNQESVVAAQLSGNLAGLTAEEAGRVVIAYEPVWAIGTGRTATPQDAQAMHGFVRQWLAREYGAGVAENTRILYGGSVKPENVDSLLLQPDIDGALVGGASLKAESFIRIIKYEV